MKILQTKKIKSKTCLNFFLYTNRRETEENLSLNYIKRNIIAEIIVEIITRNIILFVMSKCNVYLLPYCLQNHTK